MEEEMSCATTRMGSGLPYSKLDCTGHGTSTSELLWDKDDSSISSRLTRCSRNADDKQRHIYHASQSGTAISGTHQSLLPSPASPRRSSMSAEPPNRGHRISNEEGRAGQRSVVFEKMPQVVEHSSVVNPDSDGSASSDDSQSNQRPDLSSGDSFESDHGEVQYTPTSTVDNITPITDQSAFSSWNSNGHVRIRDANGGVGHGIVSQGDEALPINGFPSRVQRPTAPARIPSSTYTPARRPPQFTNTFAQRQRSSSTSRSRRDPNAQYRAQEKAYVQRLRQEPTFDYNSSDVRTPSIGYSTESETEDESPSTEPQVDVDPYDQETLLYYNNDETQISEEERLVPANRERLEWYSMLASVLNGDVVRQEKKRLHGASEQKAENSLKTEVWIGVRSKVCGRSIAAQRRLIEDGRKKLDPTIESIINFEIKGETETGKNSIEQVRRIVDKIEHCESLYPTRLALENAHPRAGSEAFHASCDAVVAWHNTTRLINTQLAILQAWVGNDELDFSKARDPSVRAPGLSDESSFLERIMKEDGVKSLQGERSMLLGISKVIQKAKETLVRNATGFSERHLPPYIEELLILINFPPRLIQEIIRMRLSYAKNMKDLAQQGQFMADQMIAQFQILLRLAVTIKQHYIVIAQPEPGWDLPPCIDDNFDQVVVDALKFYFKMLNSKLSGNKNTFKEAEILEQEWDFSNEIGKHLEGGDVEVAEQFSSLTSKALSRLSMHFEKELHQRPNEPPSEMEKRYKQTLDSVRVRQRKLFRFSKLLRQRFENAAEYNISMGEDEVRQLVDTLIETGHLLVSQEGTLPNDIWLIASPSLENRPRDIQSILGTCFHAEDVVEDPTNPYVLILRPDHPIYWDGQRLDVGMREPAIDVKRGRLRLVADGSLARLGTAKAYFTQTIDQKNGIHLDTLIEQRANLPRVNGELTRIKKTTYKLSNTIIESVDNIRKQTEGLGCQDLIQTCFGFATEFGQRSLAYMDNNRRALNDLKLTHLALDWLSFICDDCIATDRRTFRWAVTALEFALARTRGQSLLTLTEQEYARLRSKVAGCMSLLISHFDIMGARSTVAAQAEKRRIDTMFGQYMTGEGNRTADDDEAAAYVRAQWISKLAELEEERKAEEAKRQALGKVLEESNEADRSLTTLSSSATNVTMRWQQGQFVGGGTFGSVYAAMNLDSGYLMAVKEIRLQDPQLIPTIAQQIRDEMGVLEVLDHPNVVSYYGIEVHRDKVYIFMEYCSGGSLAGLLEHGRIEDETVIMVYALQMLEGLAYLHQSGIVHRDIKPENILLDHNGVIKYVDFGAAKIIARQGKTLARDGTRPSAQSMTGTPMYMSPEVIKGTSEGRQGSLDVWSLGCVILEMATGRRPWASLDNEWAIMYNIAQGKPPQLPTSEQLSASGIDFLKKCFERDPSRRSTAAELLQHDWIMMIRNQVVLEPSTPSDSLSSRSSYSSGHSDNGKY